MKIFRISQIQIVQGKLIQCLVDDKDDISSNNACSYTLYGVPCYYFRKACHNYVRCNVTKANEYINIGDTSTMLCFLEVKYRIRVL